MIKLLMKIAGLSIMYFITFCLLANEAFAIKAPSPSYYFIENKTPNNKEALYLLNAHAFSAAFFKNKIVYGYQVKKNSAIINSSITLDINNASSNIAIEAENKLETKNNILIGNNPKKWSTNLSSFSRLVYRNAYEKIDIRYQSDGSSLKSDVIIHPGGDLTDIRFQYHGINRLEIDHAGNLLIITKDKTFTESIPAAYQESNGKRHIVEVKYCIYRNNTVGLKASDYDHSIPLVIDPELIFSTFYGGSSDEIKLNYEITKDSEGFIYICGRTASSNFSVTNGVYNKTYNGGLFDTFVMKLSPSGTVPIFSTYLGGDGFDYGSDLFVTEPMHEIIALGGTNSSDFPVTAGVYQQALSYNLSPDNFDMFITKLSSDGSSIVFSTYLGNEYDEQSGFITNDPDGNIVGCSYCGPNLETSQNCFQSNCNGDYDAYIFKMSSNAKSLLKATYLGGASRERVNGLGIDELGNVYVAGHTASYDFPTTQGTIQEFFFGGGYDIYISKLNPNLSSLIFSTFLGSNGDDAPIGSLKLDSSDNIILAGFCGNDFPTSSNAFDMTFNGGASDGFVTKINSTGTDIIFSSYIGGTGNDRCTCLDLDLNGNIYLTGDCEAGFPYTKCTYDSTYNGNTDCFISILNGDASELTFSTYVGGSGMDESHGIIDHMDGVSIICETSSSDFPVSTGAYDVSYNGGVDLAYFKLGLNPDPAIADFSTQISGCLDEQIYFSNNSSNASSFEWNFGDGSISNEQEPSHAYSQFGNFIIQLIASNGCSNDTISHPITINNTSLFSDAVTICSGDSIFLAGAFRYVAGIYNDTVAISGSCDSIHSTILTVQSIVGDFLADTAILCNGNPINLDAGDCDGCSYKWSDGSNDRFIEISQVGKYWVERQNSGCSLVDSILIIPCSSFWLPNAFTPNGDGYNDRFRPIGNVLFKSFKMLIYNRWGQQIFLTNNPFEGWDGRANDSFCPDGVYYYVVFFEYAEPNSNIDKNRKQGSITLLR